MARMTFDWNRIKQGTVVCRTTLCVHTYGQMQIAREKEADHQSGQVGDDEEHSQACDHEEIIGKEDWLNGEQKNSFETS